MEPKYFAKINLDGIVETVIVAENDLWCRNNLGGEWVETFMNNPEKNYAGIGYTYDRENDNFIAPQPFPSWKLDENNMWVAPEPYPEFDPVGERVAWDEENLKWVKLAKFELLKELNTEPEVVIEKTSEEEI